MVSDLHGPAKSVKSWNQANDLSFHQIKIKEFVGDQDVNKRRVEPENDSKHECRTYGKVENCVGK